MCVRYAYGRSTVRVHEKKTRWYYDPTLTPKVLPQPAVPSGGFEPPTGPASNRLLYPLSYEGVDRSGQLPRRYAPWRTALTPGIMGIGSLGLWSGWGFLMPKPRPTWWLRFTKDAKHDMADRNITVRDVKNALRNQIEERPGVNRYATTVVIVGTAMDGRPLCVTVEEEDRKRVVSLFWA